MLVIYWCLLCLRKSWFVMMIVMGVTSSICLGSCLFRWRIFVPRVVHRGDLLAAREPSRWAMARTRGFVQSVTRQKCMTRSDV